MHHDPHHEAAASQGRLRAEFYFRLDPSPASQFAGDGTDDRFCTFKREMFKELGVKMGDKYWTQLDSAFPNLQAVVERLEHLRDEGIAQIGSGNFGIWLEDDPERPLEWFELVPRRSIDVELDPPKHKACNVPPGVHVASSLHTFVSERFKSVVESESFRGIEFLWVRDVGRYKAPQWYEPMATSCLGRGLEHPWFDWRRFRDDYLAATRERMMLDHFEETLGVDAGDKIDRKRAELQATRRARVVDQWRRHGARQFVKWHFADGVTTGDPWLDRLVEMFPNESSIENLTVVSFARVLRQFVPETDFAFLWGEPHGDAHDQSDVAGNLCFTRRVRDRLISAGVVRPAECLGVLVLDQAPKGATVLDRVGEPPPARLSREALREFREKEAKAWTAFVAKPRTPRTATLKRSLTMLRNAKTNSPMRFGKRGSTRNLQRCHAALPESMPGAWEQVLTTADGFRVFGADDEEITINATADLPRFHEESVAHIVDIDLTSGGQRLYVGHWDIGDLLALDLTGRQPDGECPVVRISHETFEEERRWQTVAAFVEDVVGGAG
jgi:hypothetical protein